MNFVSLLGLVRFVSLVASARATPEGARAGLGSLAASCVTSPTTKLMLAVGSIGAIALLGACTAPALGATCCVAAVAFHRAPKRRMLVTAVNSRHPVFPVLGARPPSPWSA